MQDFDFDGFDLNKVGKYDLSQIRSNVMGATGKPHLYYFAGGVGRAECTRLVLHAGGVKFDETGYDMGKWSSIQADAASPPGMMFGTIPSMPCLFHGDSVKLAFNTATLEYAAELGLRPKMKMNAVQKSIDVMVAAAVRDMHEWMYPAAFALSEKVKAKLMEALPGQLQPTLDGLELLCSRYAGPFMYSKTGPGMADLAVFDVVTSPMPGLLALNVSLAPYPRLQACAQAVQETKGYPSLLQHLENRIALGIPAFSVDARIDTSSGAELPDTTDKPLELIYFDGVGRGQLMRYLLMAGNLKFKDTRLKKAEWQQMKQDTSSAPGKLFRQLPVLVHGDHIVGQSFAVASYIADIGINKVSPPLPHERAMDSCVHAAVEAIRKELYKVQFAPEGKGRQAAAKACAVEIRPFLDGLERLYGVVPHTPFLYRMQELGPSLADIAVLDVVFSEYPGIVRLGVADPSMYTRVLYACHCVSLGETYPVLAEQLKEDLAPFGKQT